MNVYAHADNAIQKLNDTMGREFQNLSVSMPFDELNVIDVKKKVGLMFKRIDREVHKEYRKLVKKVRKDAEKETGVPVKLSTALILGALFQGYDEVTKYVYLHEWTRKRDRLVESLMASGNRRELREALKRSLSLLGGQIAQYADNLTDEVRVAVFEEAGVTNVVWNTQRDQKVCETCEERDLQIFRIDRLPPKHWKCRCYLTAAPKGS